VVHCCHKVCARPSVLCVQYALHIDIKCLLYSISYIDCCQSLTSSDGVLENMSLASRSWSWPRHLVAAPCTERSSKFSRACVSKEHTNAVKNFTEVTMNELTVESLSLVTICFEVVYFTATYLQTFVFCVLFIFCDLVCLLDGQVVGLDICVFDPITAYQTSDCFTASTTPQFKVIQGHRSWCQSKVHI